MVFQNMVEFCMLEDEEKEIVILLFLLHIKSNTFGMQQKTLQKTWYKNFYERLFILTKKFYAWRLDIVFLSVFQQNFVRKQILRNI